MSSPNLNNIIIVGCIVTYLSVFLLGADGGLVPDIYFTNICAVRSLRFIFEKFLFRQMPTVR